MPKTLRVRISRKPGETLAEFDPSAPTIASGDLVFWANDDEKEKHKPQSTNPEDNIWMDFPIAKKVPGQDSATSNTVAFQNTQVAILEVEYVCELHPGETGKIKVTKQP